MGIKDFLNDFSETELEALDSQGGFQKLIEDIREKDDPGLTWALNESIDSIKNYVMCIRTGESIKQEDFENSEAYREEAQRVDTERRIAHNALMDNLNILRRVGNNKGIDTSSIPKTENRHKITQWTLDVYKYFAKIETTQATKSFSKKTIDVLK